MVCCNIPLRMKDFEGSSDFIEVLYKHVHAFMGLIHCFWAPSTLYIVMHLSLFSPLHMFVWWPLFLSSLSLLHTFTATLTQQDQLSRKLLPLAYLINTLDKHFT